MAVSGNRTRGLREERLSGFRRVGRTAREWLFTPSSAPTRLGQITRTAAAWCALLGAVGGLGFLGSAFVGDEEPARGDEPSTSAPEDVDRVAEDVDRVVVDVPRLDGMTPDEAEDALGDVGLHLGDVVEVDSDAHPPGRVVGQSHEAGSTSEAGTSVDIEVTGASLTVVPDLDGLSETEAAERLSDAGLDMEVITEPADVPAGQVLGQQPAAEHDAAEGSSVAVTVSRGPAPLRLASSDIEPIDEQRCLRGTNTGYRWSMETVRLGQQQFGNAWVCDMFEHANGWLLFEIGGRGFTEFSAHVGLSDRSTSTGEQVRFTVHGDGVELARVEVDSQDVKELTADVSDVSHLRLEVLKLVHAEGRWTVGSSIGAIAEPMVQ